MTRGYFSSLSFNHLIPCDGGAEVVDQNIVLDKLKREAERARDLDAVFL